MAKVPLRGAVKTRLEPLLAPEKCAELAAAFLLDAENKAKSVCQKTILAYTPADQRSVLESILAAENILVQQRGADLGARMANAFRFAFAEGADAVVMTGTDSPTFSAEFIDRAFEFLETDSDLVLGESADGGFYLIGLRKFDAALFDGVAWSTPSVYAQTVLNAERLGFKLQTLPASYDIDTPSDLIALRDEMLNDEKAQIRAPTTYQWLLSNAELFDR